MHHAFEKSRENMIEGQLRPNGIVQPALLAALRFVPRERFVPRHMQSVAYVDEDIPLGNGRHLPETAIVARLIQAAAVTPDDVVLDIGCGAGYSSALLGQLSGTVIGTETDAGLVKDADKQLNELGIVNAVIVQRETLNNGYAEQGPYNVILINGAVSAVPNDIRNQLATGGRLVAVISTKGGMGTAVLITRTSEGTLTQHALFDASTPTLTGFEAAQGFVF